MRWHPAFSVVMPERKHTSPEEGRVFSRIGCDCQMLQSPDGFSSLFPGRCWAEQGYICPYHHFVAPLLHSLKHFTTGLKPQHCLSLAPLSAVRCILQQNSSVRISQGTWNDPGSLIYLWAPWLMWMLLQ